MHFRQLAIGFISFLLTLSGASAVESVRITNGEWPPFASQNLSEGGPLSRIVSAAFALEGITVEYGFFPWKRSYDYARTGKWDGSIAWEPNTEHIEDFYMSRPLVKISKALYHLKSTPFEWNTIGDLKQWRVGATAGYSYGAEWQQAASNNWIKVETVVTDEQSLMKLLKKRVDVVAMETDVAEYLIRTQLSPEEAELITRHPKLLAESPVCLALSRQLPKNADLMTRFNRGLQRLKDSGEYDTYIAEIRPKPRTTRETAPRPRVQLAK